MPSWSPTKQLDFERMYCVVLLFSLGFFNVQEGGRDLFYKQRGRKKTFFPLIIFTRVQFLIYALHRQSHFRKLLT